MSSDFEPRLTDLPHDVILFDGDGGADLYHAFQAHQYSSKAHEMLEKAELHIPDGKEPVFGIVAFLKPSSWRSAINEVRFMRALHYRKAANKHLSKLTPLED